MDLSCKKDFQCGLSKKEVCKRLKRETLPLFLYGAGKLADIIYKELQGRNIKIEGVFVDSLYYRMNQNFKGFSVMCIEDIDFDCNIFLAHLEAYRKMDEIKERKCINEVFYFNDIFEERSPITREYLVSHKEKFMELYDILSDDLSRRSLEMYFVSRAMKNYKLLFDIAPRDYSIFDNDVIDTDIDRSCFLDVGAYEGRSIKWFLDVSRGGYKKSHWDRAGFIV